MVKRLYAFQTECTKNSEAERKVWDLLTNKLIGLSIVEILVG